MFGEAMMVPEFGDETYFARMVDVVGWTVRSLAEELQDLDEGWAVRTPSLPQVWTLNQVRVTRTTTVSDIAVVADRHQDGLSYRHVEVVRDFEGRVEVDARSADWNVGREVYMLLADPPSEQVDVSDITGLTEEQVTVLMGMWAEEDHPGISASSRAQLEEASRREGRLWGERCFGILDGDGSPLAVTKLRTNGEVAWIEDVFTAPEARQRGYARRLVSHTTRQAVSGRPEMTFIIADDNDWPKNLYASVGFRPVGLTWTIHRELGGHPSLQDAAR